MVEKHPGEPKILVISGPNINMLGKREVEIYGSTTFKELNDMLQHIADHHKLNVECFQSNHEGDIVDKIQGAYDTTDGIIINPAALTHTSIAIRDALSLYPQYVIEVHISNIQNREEFRKQSMISPVVIGSISGFGIDSYRLAFIWLVRKLEQEE